MRYDTHITAKGDLEISEISNKLSPFPSDLSTLGKLSVNRTSILALKISKGVHLKENFELVPYFKCREAFFSFLIEVKKCLFYWQIILLSRTILLI